MTTPPAGPGPAPEPGSGPEPWGRDDHVDFGAPGRRRTGVLVAIIVVAVAVLVAAALLISRLMSSSSSPGETVESMLEAAFGGDCDGIQETVSADYFTANFGDCEEYLAAFDADLDPDTVQWTVEDVTEDGSTAEVDISITFDPEETIPAQHTTFLLGQEDGRWVVTGTEND